MIDKFDTSVLEGVEEECEGARVRGGDLGLEFSDGAEPDLGAVGQVFLGPSEEAACGAALSRGDHGAI